MLPEYLGMLRVVRWSKNVTIFLGILLAAVVSNTGFSFELVFSSLLLFFLFCLVSSGNYIMNDLTDLDFDARHPDKKNRFITSNKITKNKAIFFMLTLWFFSLIGSLLLNNLVLIILLLFIFSAILYNIKPFRAKNLPYIDVITESVNNPLRMLAGWFLVIPSFPSVIMILFLWGYAAALMAGKRLAELRALGIEKAVHYRKVFMYYSEQNLGLSVIIYSILSLILFALLSIKFNFLFLLIDAMMALQLYWYYRIVFKPNSVAQNESRIFKEKTFTIYSIIMVLLGVIIFLFA